MNIENILKVIGPAASIIFAAWIFMGFLQSRFDAAYERYLDVIEKYRDADPTGRRRQYLKEEIATYKLRCNVMNVASSIGLISAIFLLASIIAGELVILAPGMSSPLAYASAGGALIGFALVLVAAVIVFFEGLVIHRQIHHQSWNVPDLD